MNQTDGIIFFEKFIYLIPRVFIITLLHYYYYFLFADALVRLAWQHVGALTLSVWSFGLCFIFLGPLKLCKKLGTNPSIDEDFRMRESETALPGKNENIFKFFS